MAKQGFIDLEFDTYDTDWNSEAYNTVSGQNSNNSVRVPNSFMKAVLDDKDWHLHWRIEKNGPKKKDAPLSRVKLLKQPNFGTRLLMRHGPALTLVRSIMIR